MKPITCTYPKLGNVCAVGTSILICENTPFFARCIPGYLGGLLAKETGQRYSLRSGGTLDLHTPGHPRGLRSLKPDRVLVDSLTWNSRGKELSEEIAALLSKDKGMPLYVMKP